jgi:hypothetical protein
MSSYTTMMTWAALAAAWTAGCAPTPEPTASTGELLDSEPGSTAADYHTTKTQLRLLGVQAGDGSGGYATLADRSSWTTHNFRVGDFIGRNYQVSALTADGVDIRSVNGSRHLTIAGDLDLDTIRHRFDDAAHDLGRHRWSVDGATMSDIRARYGDGATGQDQWLAPPSEVPLVAQNIVVLADVDPRGVLGRFGLRSGDIVLAVDGSPFQAAGLGALAQRLATPASGTVTVTVAQGGVRYPLVVEVD